MHLPPKKGLQSWFHIEVCAIYELDGDILLMMANAKNATPKS
jgi:hypothetical protein